MSIGQTWEVVKSNYYDYTWKHMKINCDYQLCSGSMERP